MTDRPGTRGKLEINLAILSMVVLYVLICDNRVCCGRAMKFGQRPSALLLLVSGGGLSKISWLQAYAR